MSREGMIRRCAVEIRVWQYFRWIFLAYGFVCIGVGGWAYTRACMSSRALAGELPVTGNSILAPLGKAATSADPATAMRMEMKATNLQLVYELKHMAEQTEQRAWLTVVFGLGVVLFTLYRWKGSLAARIALEFAEPLEGSGKAGNA